MELRQDFYRNLDEYMKRVPFPESIREDFAHEKPFRLEKSEDYEGVIPIRELDDLMGQAGETFHEMLFRLIREKNLKDAQVYRRANVDRRLFSKIRANPAYHPRKGTILALAVAMELDITDTAELLARAEYALSPTNKTDVIVRYCIEHAVFDIFTVNQVLSRYGLPELV